MIANEERPALVSETTPEVEALVERSSAPTLRDLRAEAKDLFTNIEAETDSTLPDDRPSQQPA
jgi:hypothetical protein